jgi:hypothetical protein
MLQNNNVANLASPRPVYDHDHVNVDVVVIVLMVGCCGVNFLAAAASCPGTRRKQACGLHVFASRQ